VRCTFKQYFWSCVTGNIILYTRQCRLLASTANDTAPSNMWSKTTHFKAYTKTSVLIKMASISRCLRQNFLFPKSGSEDMQMVCFKVLFLSNPVTWLDKP